MSAVKKSHRNPETGALEPLELKLLPVQLAWLENLVAQGCYGNSKQAIMVGWMTERFRELIKSGCLPSAAELNTRSTVESKIVSIDGKAEDFASQTKNDQQEGTTR